MEITKDYIESQIKNLQEQHQSGTAHVIAMNGAIQALQGLISYADSRIEISEPKPEVPDENPDSNN